MNFITVQKVFGFVCAVFLFFPMVGYAGLYGPVQPDIEKGKVFLGTGYYHLSEKWELGSAEKDTQQSQVSVYGGVGLGKGWKAVVKGGLADRRITNGFVYADKFSGKFRPFSSLAVSGPIVVLPAFVAGVFLQGEYYSLYTDKTAASPVISGVRVTDGVEKVSISKQWGLNAGLCFQVPVEERGIKMNLYIGPVYKQVSATYKSAFSSSLGTSSVKEDVKLKHVFAGFAGAQVPLTAKSNLDLEIQFDGDTSAGVGLNFLF